MKAMKLKIIELTELDAMFILSTLDLMGMALAGHHHKWTVWERANYNKAIGMLRFRKEPLQPRK